MREAMIAEAIRALLAVVLDGPADRPWLESADVDDAVWGCVAQAGATMTELI